MRYLRISRRLHQKCFFLHAKAIMYSQNNQALRLTSAYDAIDLGSEDMFAHDRMSQDV